MQRVRVAIVGNYGVNVNGASLGVGLVFSLSGSFMNAKRIPPKNIHAHDMGKLNQESWKVFQIMSEFVEGFERLAAIEPSVSVFGSARIKEGHDYYDLTREICKRLSDEGFAIVSGGGPGLMEAANRGAYEGKDGLSVGLNIDLPHEQTDNGYQDISMHFRHFFSRKTMFVKYATAYVVMPGGFGTLDELAEILTLIQTGKSRRIPVVLVGSMFWQGLLDWFVQRLVAEGMIKEEDLQLMTVVDDADAVLAAIEAFYKDRPYAPTPEEVARVCNI